MMQIELEMVELEGLRFSLRVIKMARKDGNIVCQGGGTGGQVLHVTKFKRRG